MGAEERPAGRARMRNRFTRVLSWVFTAIGVAWFIWPFIGLIADPDEPKLLTIFGFSLLCALIFLALGQMIRLAVRSVENAGNREGTGK